MNKYLQTKYYYVESYCAWIIVHTNNKRKAKTQGIWEFGRGQVKNVREATYDELRQYEKLKGKVTFDA